MSKIAILAEYNPDFPPHPATNAALFHSSQRLGVELKADWISTEDIDLAMLEQYSALWIGPGSTYKNLLKTLQAIRYARENGVPCLGTCGGFQHMVIEYARNVLGYEDAQHAEYDPYASNLFISSLACSLAGREMTLRLAPGSRIAEIYSALEVTEEYYCNFGVSPEAAPLMKKGPTESWVPIARAIFASWNCRRIPFSLQLFTSRRTDPGPRSLILLSHRSSERRCRPAPRAEHNAHAERAARVYKMSIR